MVMGETGSNEGGDVVSVEKTQARTIPIVYATSRKWKEKKGEFGHNRGKGGKNGTQGLTWGQVTVVLRGEAATGSNKKDLVQYEKRGLNGGEVSNLLKGKQVVVFLHGFNSSFQDAVISYAKLIEQFMLVTNEKKIEKKMMKSMTKGEHHKEKGGEGGLVFVIYSWPSFGLSGISPVDKAPFYWKDDQRIKEEVSSGYIQEFLDTLRRNSSSSSNKGKEKKKEKEKKNRGKKERKDKGGGEAGEEDSASCIDIIAHDLGGKLLFSALKHCSPDLPPFRRVSFLATQVKKNAIRKHFNNRISKKCAVINNYYCRKDRSLHLAELTSKRHRKGGAEAKGAGKGGKGDGGGVQKLIGQSTLEVEGPGAQHIFNIRVPSELAKEVSKDMHSYFLAPEIASDLALQLFTSLKSPKDRRLLPVLKAPEGEQKGWKIPYHHDEPTTLPGVIEYLQKELGDKFSLVEKHVNKIKLAAFITGNGRLLTVHNHHLLVMESSVESAGVILHLIRAMDLMTGKKKVGVGQSRNIALNNAYIKVFKVPLQFSVNEKGKVRLGVGQKKEKTGVKEAYAFNVKLEGTVPFYSWKKAGGSEQEDQYHYSTLSDSSSLKEEGFQLEKELCYVYPPTEAVFGTVPLYYLPETSRYTTTLGTVSEQQAEKVCYVLPTNENKGKRGGQEDEGVVLSEAQATSSSPSPPTLSKAEEIESWRLGPQEPLNEMSEEDHSIVQPAYLGIASIVHNLSQEEKAKFLDNSSTAFHHECPVYWMPRMLTHSEHDLLMRGVEQRAKAIQMFLNELHSRPLSSKGTTAGIPNNLLMRILLQSQELSLTISRESMKDRWDFFYGPDILRGPDGTFYVCEDNVGFVGGLGDLPLSQYLLSRHIPAYQDTVTVPSAMEFYQQLVDYYRSIANGKKVVLLRYPGSARGGSYEDDRFMELLAGEGVEVVEIPLKDDKKIKEDETYEDGELLPIGPRLKIIDNEDGARAVLKRRINGIDQPEVPVGVVICHILPYDTDIRKLANDLSNVVESERKKAKPMLSARVLKSFAKEKIQGKDRVQLMKRIAKHGMKITGISVERAYPSILKASYEGNLRLVNPPGFEFVGDKQFCILVDGLIQHYLKEKPIISGIPTYSFSSLETPQVVDQALLDKVFMEDFRPFAVVKRVDGKCGEGVFVGRFKTPQQWSEVREKVIEKPSAFIVQKYVPMARVHDRIVDLRGLVNLGGSRITVSKAFFGRGSETSSGLVNISQGGFEMVVATALLPDRMILKSTENGKWVRLDGNKQLIADAEIKAQAEVFHMSYDSAASISLKATSSSSWAGVDGNSTLVANQQSISSTGRFNVVFDASRTIVALQTLHKSFVGVDPNSKTLQATSPSVVGSCRFEFAFAGST